MFEHGCVRQGERNIGDEALLHFQYKYVAEFGMPDADALRAQRPDELPETSVTSDQRAVYSDDVPQARIAVKNLYIALQSAGQPGYS